MEKLLLLLLRAAENYYIIQTFSPNGVLVFAVTDYVGISNLGGETAVMLVKKSDLFRGIWLSEQLMKYYFNVLDFIEK